MKKYFIPILVVFVFIWAMKGINSVSSQRDTSGYDINLTVDSQAKEGLDLQALTELVKKGKSAEDIERKLNQPGGINNLDLDGNNKVDFINVTEYGNKRDAYGFSFTVKLENGEEQEIAEVEIKKNGENADIVTRGNEQIYGQNQYYHSYLPISTFLLWSYLMSPHPFYHSPWSHSYYPSYYNSYRPVGRDLYRTRVRNVTRNSTTRPLAPSSVIAKSSLSNPNRGKYAKQGIKKSLVNPTRTQKQFQVRKASGKIGSGGFGRQRKSSFGGSTTSRSYSARGFSSSRGYGGFGK
jgi:hypothetical protein